MCPDAVDVRHVSWAWVGCLPLFSSRCMDECCGWSWVALPGWPAMIIDWLFRDECSGGGSLGSRRLVPTCAAISASMFGSFQSGCAGFSCCLLAGCEGARVRLVVCVTPGSFVLGLAFARISSTRVWMSAKIVGLWITFSHSGNPTPKTQTTATHHRTTHKLTFLSSRIPSISVSYGSDPRKQTFTEATSSQKLGWHSNVC